MAEFNIPVNPTGDGSGNNKKKSSTSKTSKEQLDDSKVTQEIANFLRDIEASYAKGTKAIPSGEVLKFLEASGVKLGKSILRDVLEKGGVWVYGKEGLKGTAVQNLRYENDRDDPGKKRRDVNRTLRQKMDQAISNNASLLVDAINKEIDTSIDKTAKEPKSKKSTAKNKSKDADATAKQVQGELVDEINQLKIFKDNKWKIASVTAANEEDGWRVKHVKVTDPNTGMYEYVPFPHDAARGYASFEQARDEVFSVLKEKYKEALTAIESDVIKTPLITDESNQTKSQSKRKKSKKEISEQIIEDATSVLDEVTDKIGAIGTSGGGGTGGGKGGKRTGGGGDGSDDEDMSGDYDPNDPDSVNRYFKARVENLQRTLKTRTFGEEESIIFSSLQGMYDKATRVQDIDTLKQIVNSATRSQVKTLKSFATDIENQTNLLTAIAETQLEKELAKEEPNKEVMDFYNERIKELEQVQDKTAKVYSSSKQRIVQGMREEAKKGFAAGETARLQKELEQIRKDDDRIVEEYQTQFTSYIETQYKKFAANQAEEKAKSFIEQNAGKMSNRKLMIQAGEIFDTEVSSLMAKMDIESGASRVDILKLYGKQGDEFSKKNFLKDYAIKYGQDDFFQQVLKNDYENNPVLKPTKGTLGKYLPDNQTTKSQFHNNIARFLQIQEGFSPVVSATSEKGTTGSQALGGFAKAAYATNTPQGMLIGATLQSVGYLAEIAENTSNRIQAFAPEVLQAKLENKLDMLVRTIRTGESSGSDFAKYQRSSNMINAQLFELGVQFYASFGRGVEFIIDSLSLMVILIRALVSGIGFLLSFMSKIYETLGSGIRIVVGAVDRLMNFGKDRTNTAVPDYTDELLKNRPQGI